ncbi:hypothetical protein CWO90_43025 [Bradyrhizobium sp. Leo121]|nr:hypothetical protein CWO90_43025 [Bradyrhizobium sp. Leo121]
MKVGFSLAAAILALALTTVVPPAQASGGHRGDRDDDWHGHWHGHTNGAPGPIAGAGLPILAIGYGVYWLVRRRRKPTDA